jgi:DcmR-like sensory protein
LRRTGHILLVHHSEGERLRWLAGWCDIGLRQGEKVVYVDVAGWGAETLRSAIALRGLDVSQAVDRGQFEFIGAEELLGMGDGREDALAAALAGGYPGARLTVRQDALEQQVGPDVVARVERGLAALCHEAPVSVLCQYDGRTTVDDALTRALDRHPDWVFESDLSVRRSGHVIEVEGRLDSLDEVVLDRSLTRMTSRLSPSRPLTLDMHDVTSLSLGAYRALVRGTEAFRRRGGQVDVGAPHGLDGRLLRMLPEGDEPGLQLHMTTRTRHDG